MRLRCLSTRNERHKKNVKRIEHKQKEGESNAQTTLNWTIKGTDMCVCLDECRFMVCCCLDGKDNFVKRSYINSCVSHFFDTLNSCAIESGPVKILREINSGFIGAEINGMIVSCA